MTNLNRVYDSIHNCACPDDCSECCTAVYPSIAEEANIRIYLLRQHKKFVPFNHDITKKCPYLEDGLCAIYSVRPLMCRLYGVADGWLCPKAKGDKMPAVEVEWCLGQLYGHGKERKHLRKMTREVLDALRGTGQRPLPL